MKVAITAASGQLGGAIVKATTAMLSNDQVIALARTPEKASDLGIEVRLGDYTQPEQLEQSLKDIDALLLLSGNEAPDQRIIQHRNVITAAKRAGVSKIVYTSIQGAEFDTEFSPIVQSNRQTEQDVRESGLEWAIGRNGIYIEPDIEYVENYKKLGGIINCAGDARCGYTNRTELAYAYAKMLTEDKHNGQTYNLNGEAITQKQLASYINEAFGTALEYKAVSFEEFRAMSIKGLGEFVGNIIGGIYQGISQGKANNPSDYERAAGRPHQTWSDFFATLKQS